MKEIKIKENFSLKKYNTFNIEVFTNEYFEYDDEFEIQNFLDNTDIHEKKYFILGEGSNVLFTKDFDGLVIRPANKGIKIIAEDNDKIELSVAAGENWDDFVEHCVNHDYCGIENLSLIPGTVGASVVQNIGAYGAEVSDVVTKVKYFDLADGEISILNNMQCNFAYRDSIFKNDLKNRIIIISVNFELKKNTVLNLDYADVARYMKKVDNPGLKQMRKAIIDIRNSKLPDPNKIGNAGSFFKNPLVDQFTFMRIKSAYPEIKYYRESPFLIKIAAAWLIDNCNLKGFEHNGAAVHDKQPLVLVNKNNATGKDILELSKIVQEEVFKNFGIMLAPEVIVL